MNNETKTVLCVEDNPTNLLLISRITEAEKLNLVVAEDGLYAEELLQELRPDLILMDVNLPGIDGLELTRRIRADSALPIMPIIATTANVLVGDRERCIEAGCTDYLPKPLDIRELRKMMRHYLDEYEAAQKAAIESGEKDAGAGADAGAEVEAETEDDVVGEAQLEWDEPEAEMLEAE